MGVTASFAKNHQGEVYCDYSKMLKKLKVQSREISYAPDGKQAFGDQEAIREPGLWEPVKFNSKRMIRLGLVKGEHLFGSVDTKEYEHLLENLDPILAPDGKPLAIITRFTNVGFVGCSCPPFFNEIFVALLVKGDSQIGSSQYATHIVPLFFGTDHIKRQHTLVTKFSIPEQFLGFSTNESQPDHISSIQEGNKLLGFYAKDQLGNMILEARRGKGAFIKSPSLESPYVESLWRLPSLGRYRFEGNKKYDVLATNGSKLTGTRFRIIHDSRVGSRVRYGYNPLKPDPQQFFNPLTDTFKVSGNSLLAKTLRKLNFTPLMWNSEESTGGIAYTGPLHK